MSMRPASDRPCRKDGIILTCYVNGRKLFRAIRGAAADDGVPHLPAPRASLMRRSTGSVG